jgi:virulence factor Mce-like protein
MRRRSSSAVLANPVLVGAVTVLVVIVAVFLAYNANNGLPFVPTFELKAVVPSGAKLVAGNEVRDGGYRVGVVSRIESIKLPDGSAGARLTMKIDQKATPIPADTSLKIRPRSALGLKYVELERGTAADTLVDGTTISAGEEALAPELQEFFNIFDEKTRVNVQKNLVGFGNAFAYRGMAINRALESLPRFMASLPPVMRVLASDEANIKRFFDELADAARVSAPIARQMAQGFADGADTFGALSADPQALKDTIAESPATLEVGTRSLRAQRPFLASLVEVSGELQGAAAQLRQSAPGITRALRSGIGPLNRLPQLNRRLTGSFQALDDLATAPGSDMGVAALNETVNTLNPQLRYLGPFITVCNAWNYSFTLLADHMTDQDQTGQVERVQAKTVDGAQDNMDAFGEAHPTFGAHAQQFGAAIDDRGNADCEWGQRGYPRSLVRQGPHKGEDLVVDPDTPGIQGTTFTGRPKVLDGQTFSRLPDQATGPQVRP